jgi:hypothetical protein
MPSVCSQVGLRSLRATHSPWKYKPIRPANARSHGPDTLLFELRKVYRQQHDALCWRQTGGNVTNTTRRQRHFRPRGRVYVALLKLHIQWESP